MSPPPDASDIYDQFHTLSDESWLKILLASLTSPVIDSIQMPGFPSKDIQLEMHGHAGEVSIHEAYLFFREVKTYLRYFGHPLQGNTRVLDFGCGWGRVLRLFMKDVRPENLFGIDSTSRFLLEARRSNPALNFIQSALVPPTLLLADSLDVIVSWSVFSHLDEWLAGQWIHEFYRLLRPGGVAFVTTQSRRFIDFCADLREQRLAGVRLKHQWYELCADSFVDPVKAYAHYDNGHFLYTTQAIKPHPGAHYGEALIPRAYMSRQWGNLFKILEFLDDPSRLPQVFVMLHKPLYCS